MKPIALFSLLFFLSFPSFSQIVRPIQSESMYKQIRSMEDGPWEFAPEGWYYSWYMKKFKIGFISFKTKVPGAGAHDRGPAGVGLIGDGYVRKYKPSGQVRAKMIALAEITRKQYEAVAEKYTDMGKREALDATDRKIDVAIQVYSSRFSTMYNNIQTLCNIYEKYAGVGASQVFRDEKERIKDNISYISKSYSRNAERSKAYLKELKNLEKLSQQINSACNRAYVKHYTSNFKI